METLLITPTEDTPGINMNSNGYCEIYGRSLPENVVLFYANVIDWINNFFSQSRQEFILTIKLEYFNTATSKILMDILLMTDSEFTKGRKIKVIWCYKSIDEDMREAGEEFSEMVSYPFEFMPNN